MTPPVSTPIHDVDDVPAASTRAPDGAGAALRPDPRCSPSSACASPRWSPSAARRPTTSPATRNYYVNRQAVYFVVGAVLAVVLARIDYSRLRGAKYVVYGLLIASILAVSALGSVARGSRRAIDLGFFSFQASELGKVLLVVALAAFVVDRPRALHNRDTTVRVMLLTLIPAGAGHRAARPRLGPGLHRRRPRRALRGRRQLAPLRRALRALRGGHHLHPRGRAEGRRDRPARLSEGPPHGLPAPDRQPGQAGLSAEPVAHRHRLR